MIKQDIAGYNIYMLYTDSNELCGAASTEKKFSKLVLDALHKGHITIKNSEGRIDMARKIKQNTSIEWLKGNIDGGYIVVLKDGAQLLSRAEKKQEEKDETDM